MSSSGASNDAGSDAIFFWRETEKPYGFLSQWYNDAFVVDGVTYVTAEMWMMVQKAKLFGDEVQLLIEKQRVTPLMEHQDIAKQMQQTHNPRQHQALGRKVKNFDRKTWDEHKSRIVEEGNYHKFTRSVAGEELLQKLLGTGDRQLVEASPYDSIWGIGFAAKQAKQNREHWGENRLGEAIMVIRARLVEEKKSA